MKLPTYNTNTKHNKFITKANKSLGMLSSRSSSSDNYEIQELGWHMYDLFELIIKQTNKISQLEKDIKRLKKLNQRPYQRKQHENKN